MVCKGRNKKVKMGAPRGYGEQGNLGIKWILGSNLEFLLGEQSNNILGIREINKFCKSAK